MGWGTGSGPLIAAHRLTSGPPHGKISRLWWGVQWQPGPVNGASLFPALSQNRALLAVLSQLRESSFFSAISKLN